MENELVIFLWNLPKLYTHQKIKLPFAALSMQSVLLQCRNAQLNGPVFWLKAQWIRCWQTLWCHLSPISGLPLLETYWLIFILVCFNEFLLQVVNSRAGWAFMNHASFALLNFKRGMPSEIYIFPWLHHKVVSHFGRLHTHKLCVAARSTRLKWMHHFGLRL